MFVVCATWLFQQGSEASIDQSTRGRGRRTIQIDGYTEWHIVFMLTAQQTNYAAGVRGKRDGVDNAASTSPPMDSHPPT